MYRLVWSHYWLRSKLPLSIWKICFHHFIQIFLILADNQNWHTILCFWINSWPLFQVQSYLLLRFLQTLCWLPCERSLPIGLLVYFSVVRPNIAKTLYFCDFKGSGPPVPPSSGSAQELLSDYLPIYAGHTDIILSHSFGEKSKNAPGYHAVLCGWYFLIY